VQRDVVGEYEFDGSENLKTMLVIPAKAGIQRLQRVEAKSHWIPAFAGMTIKSMGFEKLPIVAVCGDGMKHCLIPLFLRDSNVEFPRAWVCAGNCCRPRSHRRPCGYTCAFPRKPAE
jgi:hypothetical protein